MKLSVLTMVLSSLLACSYMPESSDSSVQISELEKDSSGNILSERFLCPDSFDRVACSANSFAHYLRNLPLKPEGSKVLYFDGTYKNNTSVYAAVVDMPISAKDLQQCADAVMRLRAEFLFGQKRYSEIAFRFTGDGKMHDYLSYAGSDRSYKRFLKYMEHVFDMANTASLYRQLKPKSIADIEPGDVFIQTGQPYGHAVIVADVCKDKNGNVKYMLAQSYMPAQETQILNNPRTKGVWYDLYLSGDIVTPEWTFQTLDLRTW